MREEEDSRFTASLMSFKILVEVATKCLFQIMRAAKEHTYFLNSSSLVVSMGGA